MCMVVCEYKRVLARARIAKLSQCVYMCIYIYISYRIVYFSLVVIFNSSIYLQKYTHKYCVSFSVHIVYMFCCYLCCYCCCCVYSCYLLLLFARLYYVLNTNIAYLYLSFSVCFSFILDSL